MSRKIIGGLATVGLTVLAGSMAAPANAQWTVTVQSNFGTGINDINTAETLLATGGTPEGTDNPTVLNYNTTFPGVGNADTFALEATGFVNIAGGGSLSNLTLYVNSDDGFRVRRNGATLFEFSSQTAGSNTSISGVTLNNGDLLRVTFFENGGGQFLRFRLNDDSGPFIGDPASGITITPTSPLAAAAPEPGSLVLAGLGIAGLTARRRWRRRQGAGA